MNRCIYKTAKEKFEENLWTQTKCDDGEIVYETMTGTKHYTIVFDLMRNVYTYSCDGCYESVDMITHELITYQLEELGLLDE